MAYQIIWKEKGVHILFSGDFSDQDSIDCNHEIADDPRVSTMEYELADFLQVEEFSATPIGIREGALIDSKLYLINPNVKVAVVANQSVLTNLTNLYRLYLDIMGGGKKWETKIFKSRPEANEWLGI